MATRLVAPAVNGSARCVLQAWWAESGDWVNEGDRICTLVHSPYAVTLRAIESGFLKLPDQAVPTPGSTVHQGQLLGWIFSPGNDLEDLPEIALPPLVTAEHWKVKRDVALLETARRAAGDRIPASPRARRRARERKLDLAAIPNRPATAPLRERDIAVPLDRPAASFDRVSPAFFQTELHWNSAGAPAPDSVVRAALLSLSRTAPTLHEGCLVRWTPSGWTMDFFESPAGATMSAAAARKKGLLEKTSPDREVSWLLCDALQSPFEVWLPGRVSHPIPRAAVVIALGALRQPAADISGRGKNVWSMKVTISCYRADGVSVPWDVWLERFREQLGSADPSGG
ncbi:MAG: hypothetical protein KatS3mg110_3466 [Pirellulaceae bacterium]|nr:MAG: hypothetical protein KatS3mg110_3466 [Pirellulaceae bacterium]